MQRMVTPQTKINLKSQKLLNFEPLCLPFKLFMLECLIDRDIYPGREMEEDIYPQKPIYERSAGIDIPFHFHPRYISGTINFFYPQNAHQVRFVKVR